MLDIRLIREKPDFVRERLAARGGDDAAKIDEVLKVDAERRKAEKERKASAPRAADGTDPDIADIKLGPQPLADWQVEEES